MTTNKDHADVLRERLRYAAQERSIAAYHAAIALLDPPAEPTGDAAEREHCLRAVQEAPPLPRVRELCNMLIRERAAAQTYWRGKALAAAVNVHELRAENERLRAVEYELEALQVHLDGVRTAAKRVRELLKKAGK